MTHATDNKKWSTPSTLLLGGATVIAAFLIGKIGFRALQQFRGITTLPKGLKFCGTGGFERKMSRWEASQIVALNERNASRAKLAERYKSVMLANHPDRGGSPYLALKINEARKVLDPFTR